jgi:hypothetical protein
MLKVRLLIVAGLATLLGAVPVIAQDLDQGAQSEQILKKKKGRNAQQPGAAQDQNQYGGDMQPSKRKLRQDMITNQGDQGTGTRRLKKRQQATGNEMDQEDQSGQTGIMNKKRLRKTEQDQSGQISREQRRQRFTTLPAQKRNLFRQRLVSRDIQRVHRDKLRFRIGVGVRVPRNFRFYRLPPDVVEFAPEYRGYLYFLTEDGLVVIVDPDTFEIVSVFPA